MPQPCDNHQGFLAPATPKPLSSVTAQVPEASLVLSLHLQVAPCAISG